MIKNLDDEDELRIYYAYVKIIINLNRMVSCDSLDKDQFKVNLS